MSTGPNNSSKPTTSIPVAGVYNATPPAPADTQAVALQVDSQGNLKTTFAGGGSSGNVNIADVNGNPPALSNPLPVELSDGTNAVGTAGNPLSVNVITGGGSNASVGSNGAAAPTSSTQAGGSDGTNLQPLQVDASKNLKTIINAALPAGANVIGHVIADTGSTTAVTGNVTAVQPTGTNLHTVVDSGSITAVQPTGTNLHAVIDTGSTTAVTQATAANLKAEVVGAKTNNNAAPGATNVGVLPAIANAAPQSWTEGDQVLESVDLAGNQRVIDLGLNLAQASTTSGEKGPLVQGAVTTAAPAYTTAQTNPLSLTTAGALRVDGSAVTQPVSLPADVTPATQDITAQDVGSVVSTPNTNAQTSITGSPTANSAASFALSSVETVQVQVTGTWSGTNFSSEVSYDGGTTWYYAPVSQTGNNFVASQMTSNFAGSVSVGGATNYRVRATTAGSGTATVLIVKSAQPITDRPVVLGSQTATPIVISNATALNTLFNVNCAGYQTIVVTLKQGSTVTAGVLTFEAADAAGYLSATSGYLVQGLNSVATTGGMVSTYTLQANVNISFVFNVTGFSQFRARLSTAMTGTAVIIGVVQAAVGQNSTLNAITNINTVNAVTTVSTVTAAGARSTQNGAVLADNTTSLSYFTDSGNTSRTLSTAESVYGGTFSGSADATRQGWSKYRTSTVFKTATVAATATGNSAVWTPGSGNKFRLLGFQITAQGLAATVSAVVTISFQDSASGITFGTFDVDVPAVAGVISGVDIISGWVDMGHFGILSAAANNVLNFNISAAGAGTVGTYRINVAGTEE